MIPTVRADAVGWITAEQVVEVDGVMIDDLAITLVQMIEKAGRTLARDADALTSVPAHQFAILERMAVTAPLGPAPPDPARGSMLRVV